MNEKSNNLVAKYSRKFNKARVFRDRTKYKRNNKHKKAPSGAFIL